MKRTFCLILSLFFLPVAHADDSQLLDRVVAVVNDEAITQSELDILLRPLYEENKGHHNETAVLRMMSEARQKLLNQLIEDRLVLQEAKNRKIEIDDVEIDAQIEEFKKKFKSEKEMEDAMAHDRVTMTDLRDRLTKQAMVRKLQDIEIRSKIVVSPLDVEAYYEAHASEFSNKEQLRVRSITIKKSDESREKGIADEKTRGQMDKLRKKILSGGDFAELARANSQDTNAKEGGLTDWIDRGSMIPVIDDIIFKLKPGDVSEIIETPMGYHLFRVEERREGKKKTLEEAREEIFGNLYHEKARKRFAEWMEDLKRNAYISIR